MKNECVLEQLLVSLTSLSILSRMLCKWERRANKIKDSCILDACQLRYIDRDKQDECLYTPLLLQRNSDWTCTSTFDCSARTTAPALGKNVHDNMQYLTHRLSFSMLKKGPFF